MFVTAEAHAHARFRRAIERRALWMAEDAAREHQANPLLTCVAVAIQRSEERRLRRAVEGTARGRDVSGGVRQR